MGLLGGNNSNNPIIPNMQAIQQLAQAYKQIKTLANPQMALSQMIQSNPQMAQVMQMCNGKNPQDIFYSMWKQQGRDPNEILNIFK